MNIIKGISFVFALVLGIACTNKEEVKVFKHDLSKGPTPWLHEKFDGDENRFAFAIITDLNGGEREGVFEIAIEQVNLLRPELIVTVGDLIDGGTEDKAQLKKEWDSFDARAEKAIAPLFHLGGNHDLTNPVMREFWKERYGPRYYHFVYKDVLFLMLDSEDYTEERMNEIYRARAAAIKVLDGPTPEDAADMEYMKMPERSTGEISKEQSAYFSKVLEENPSVRWTFLFMHKPVWKRDDDGGLNSIERALGERPYTVFNGHFHSYSHTERNDKDYIILGTTGGSQNANDQKAFDHITVVTVNKEGPSIANLRLDGILNKYGSIPLGGDSICFQASQCK